MKESIHIRYKIKNHSAKARVAREIRTFAGKTSRRARLHSQSVLPPVKTSSTKTLTDGEVPRLRNASLCDARGFVESRETNAKKEKK